MTGEHHPDTILILHTNIRAAALALGNLVGSRTVYVSLQILVEGEVRTLRVLVGVLGALTGKICQKAHLHQGIGTVSPTIVVLV